MTNPKLARPDVACPTCGVGPRVRCKSATGKVAETHVARLAAATPIPTPEQVAQREHEQRQFDEQFSRHTLVTVAFEFTCGCTTEPSEPIQLSDANAHGVARTNICDEHDEYTVVNQVTLRLVADETTLQRILLAAGVDPRSAAYVAADQNDAARTNRIRLGMSGEPT